MTKVFKNLDEMKPYYNADTNTYVFEENKKRLNVEFDFDVEVKSNIVSGRIISGYNIMAYDITAYGDIVNDGILAAYCIYADGDINAYIIKASDIFYRAACVAYHTFKCRTVSGSYPNSQHFCIENAIEYIKE